MAGENKKDLIREVLKVLESFGFEENLDGKVVNLGDNSIVVIDITKLANKYEKAYIPIEKFAKSLLSELERLGVKAYIDVSYDRAQGIKRFSIDDSEVVALCGKVACVRLSIHI